MDISVSQTQLIFYCSFFPFFIKQLALVVEGWRKRDAEKDELLNSMQQEKCEVENSLQKQQQVMI